MLDVEVYDTTLRDGAQREGISYSVEDKLAILRRLDALGIAVVEGGWPGSNPKDAELFARARLYPLARARLAAFGATRRVGVAAAEDLSLQALLAAGTEVCTIFGKTSLLHVTEVLRTTAEENLRMIEESVAFLATADRRVIYDAEHFFDGYAADPLYALETLAAAVRGGARTVVLCDTNGGSLPWQIEAATRAAAAALGDKVRLGIHAHDDAGCGVANTLAAVRGGARHVQGTINGYGERCGNANLCAVIPGLQLKLGLSALPDGGLAALAEVSHFVAEVANLPADDHMPYVGRSAFAHKAGVHVAAMRRSAESYQHVDPALVGNESRVVVSELSGRANLVAKAEEHGLEAASAGHVLDEVKRAEARGFSYEAAEASVALLLRRREPGYRAPFKLLAYKVIATEAALTEAMIKIDVDGRVHHTAAEGQGPVSALDTALRKALEHELPDVARIQLHDYKVRILDGRLGTAAVTRVLVTAGDGERTWTTVGASTSILEASWIALADGIEYGLWLAALPREEARATETREEGAQA